MSMEMVSLALKMFWLFSVRTPLRIRNKRDYSRFDLNGDGYTGGSPIPQSVNAFFDLNADGQISADEESVRDIDILCTYAHSHLFVGTEAELNQAQEDANLSCPSLEIIAQTGDAGGPFDSPLSFFDSKVSVNNSGHLAFAGSNSSSDSAGYVGWGSGAISRITSEGLFSSRRFAGAAINNETPPTAAFRELVPGSPPTYLIRKWKSDTDVTLIGRSIGITGGLCAGGTRAGQTCQNSVPDCPIIFGPDLVGYAACSLGPSAPFDSATFWLDMNDNGIVTFLGFVNGSTQNALLSGKDETDLLRVLEFPAGTFPAVRPQAAFTDDVVFFDGNGAVKVMAPGAVGPTTIASASTYAITANRPGISADGILSSSLRLKPVRTASS